MPNILNMSFSFDGLITICKDNIRIKFMQNALQHTWHIQQMVAVSCFYVDLSSFTLFTSTLKHSSILIFLLPPTPQRNLGMLTNLSFANQ